MSYEVRYANGNVKVIEVSEELGLECSLPFRKEFEGMPQGHCIVIDVSKSDYASKRDIDILFRLSLQAEMQESKIALVGPNLYLQRLLSRCGVTCDITTYRSMKEAEEAEPLLKGIENLVN